MENEDLTNLFIELVSYVCMIYLIQTTRIQPQKITG